MKICSYLGLTICRQQNTWLTATDLAPFLTDSDTVQTDLFTQNDAMIVLVGKGSACSATVAGIGTRASLSDLLCQTDNVGPNHVILPRSFAERLQGRKARNHREAVLAVRRPLYVKLAEELVSLEVDIKWQTAANPRQMAILREVDNNNQEEEEEEDGEGDDEGVGGRLGDKVTVLLVEGSEGALENIETELVLKIVDPEQNLMTQLRTAGTME